MNSKIQDEKQQIADRLKAACADRKAYPMELLQRNGDFPKSSIYNWEAGGTSPKAEYLAHLQNLGVDVAYILTGEHRSPVASVSTPANFSGSAPAPASNEDTIYVPLLSATGSMGPGNELLTEDVILNDVPFSRHWLAAHLPRCRPAAIKLIHAYGDSMHGTLESGDFCLVDTDVIEVLIDGVYVLEAHSRLFIKRVRQRLDGRYEVSSDNEAIKTSDILDGTQQVCIKGRVVYGWNGRRF